MLSSSRILKTTLAFLFLFYFFNYPLAAQESLTQGYFTTSDQVKLHYEEAGQGEAIIFVPGWLMPADIWELQMRELSKNYHVIALDPRSQGQSDMTAVGNDPLRRSKDIRELMDHLQLSSAVLVGWSLGAFDCLAYLRQFGNDRLYALVLVDSPLGGPSGPRSAQRSPFLQGFQTDRKTADRSYVWGLSKQPLSAVFFKKLADAADQVPTDIALAVLDNTQPGDSWQPSLKTLSQVPLLYAVTAKFTTHATYLQQVDPLARVEIFQNSGHALFLEQSKHFNDLITDFLRQASLYPASLPHTSAAKPKPWSVLSAPISAPQTIAQNNVVSNSPTPISITSPTETPIPLSASAPSETPTPLGPPVRIGPPAPSDTPTETTTSTPVPPPAASTAIPSPAETPSPAPSSTGLWNTLRSLNPFHSKASSDWTPVPSPLLPMTVPPRKKNNPPSEGESLETAESSIQDQYFYTSDHVKLHYLESGEGLALVLIPGWLLPADIWMPQLEGLSSDYHVIALDPRSQGGSDMTTQGDEPLRQARDIQELLDHLHLTSVVLVGWSHGGFQVLAYMKQYGTDRLYAAALVDSALGASASPASNAAQTRFLEEFKKDRPHATRSFVWGLFKTPPPTDFFRKLADSATRTPTDIALALMNNVFPGDNWQPSLKTICQVPLLYAVTPKYLNQSNYLRQVDPLARVEIFQNSGHALFFDEAQRFNDLMRDFISHASTFPPDVPHAAPKTAVSKKNTPSYK